MLLGSSGVLASLYPCCKHLPRYAFLSDISPPSLVLNWNFSTLRSGFSQHENSNLLRSALQVLADRLKPGETEFLPLEELIRYSQYFPSFESDRFQTLYINVCLGALLRMTPLNRKVCI